MKKQELSEGDLVAFQIGEVSGFSAPNKDSWGVIKILDLGSQKDGSFSLSVKAGLWTHLPTEQQAVSSPMLVEKRFEKLGTDKSKPEPLIFTTTFDCVIDLKEARLIGRECRFSPTEQKARRKIKVDGYYYKIAAIDYAAFSIDHEHRAQFDEAAWKSELESYREQKRRATREREERESQRLKKLTIQALREEALFEDWDNRTQIVPPKFTDAVRKHSQEVLKDLNDLGPKPKRKEVRECLKDYISRINSLNGSFGYMIETEERENLMAFVEEVCWATKQKPLIAEADSWCDW